MVCCCRTGRWLKNCACVVAWQLKSAQGKLGESDRRLQDMVKASQRHTAAAAQQAGELKNRLEQADRALQKSNQETARKAAALKQLEVRLGELSSEKDVCKSLPCPWSVTSPVAASTATTLCA